MQRNPELQNIRNHKSKVIKIIKELPKNKTSIFKDIPGKIMVSSIHIYPHALTNIFQHYVDKIIFYILRYADMTLVLKNSDTTKKATIYLLVTFLKFSKIFEKLIYT